MKRKNIKSSDMKLALILMSELALNNAIIDNPNLEDDSKLKLHAYGENCMVYRVLKILQKGIKDSEFEKALNQLDQYISSIEYIDRIIYDEILMSTYRYKRDRVFK